MKEITNRGFTLIELLIVVAIIAILAAIAIPNFLAAQIRSKVARAKGEMRSLATGVESYYVDHNEYPLSAAESPCVSHAWNPAYAYYVQLSTPVAYMTNGFLRDPFGGMGNSGVPIYGPYDLRLFYDYRRVKKSVTLSGGATLIEYASGYFADPPDKADGWLFYSPGPDHWQNINSKTDNFGNTVGGFGNPLNTWAYYDPTNGTVSVGDIVMSSFGMDNSSLSSQ